MHSQRESFFFPVLFSHECSFCLRCLSLRVLPLVSERGCSAQSNLVLAKALWCAGAVPVRGLGVYPLFSERMAMQCAELVLAKAL